MTHEWRMNMVAKTYFKGHFALFIFIAACFAYFNLTIVQANAATDSNLRASSIEALMKSFASAKPELISQARKKFVAPNSSADIFAEMVENHFRGTQYLKTQDNYGNTSPTALDLPGKLKLTNKKSLFQLDSTFDRIDGKYTDFKLNNKGKITTFSLGISGQKPSSIKNDISRVSSNYKDSGVTISSGIHWNIQNSSSFVQLNFKNDFAGPRSWSYAKGWVRDADGVNHPVITGPLGCTQSGGSTVIEASTNSVTKIVKGTTNVLVVPMFRDCLGRSYDPVYVTFLVN